MHTALEEIHISPSSGTTGARVGIMSQPDLGDEGHGESAQPPPYEGEQEPGTLPHTLSELREANVQIAKLEEELKMFRTQAKKVKDRRERSMSPTVRRHLKRTGRTIEQLHRWSCR